MSEWRPFFFALTLLTPVTFGLGLLLSRGLVRWWRLPGVRIAFFLYTAGALAAFGLWAAGIVLGEHPLSLLGISGTWTVLSYGFPMTFALVGAAILLALARPRPTPPSEGDPRGREPGSVSLPSTGALAASPEPPASSPRALAPSPPRALGRRQLVTGAAAALPVASFAASTAGTVEARGPQQMPRIPMRFGDLAAPLAGLRILQLTDLHLGFFFHARHVEALFERVANDKPDLVVFTGDIADDLRELGPAMRLASELAPRLGVYAVVGNHEHFRGIHDVRRVFDRSPVPLLLNQTAVLDVGGARLSLVGIDDPGMRRPAEASMFTPMLDAALDGTPDDAFRLLLSHRPEALDVAGSRRVHLTLAGHTHGGQLGMGGRSAFERLGSRRYLWGRYERDGSQLYTSAGFGHWMPFRLACPTEAPVIVLERG